MYPILARLPHAFLYSYTAVLALAVLGVVAWSAWRATPAVAGWFEAWLAIMLGAVLGGRLAFILGNLAYFAENTAAVWRVGQGGLGLLGAGWGGWLGLWLWARWHKRPWQAYLDFWTMPLLGLYGAGWLACYLHGLAYGRPAPTRHWLTAHLPDNFGVYDERYAVQLWGMGFVLLWGGVAWWWPRWRRGGVLAAVALFHAGHTLWRGDPMPLWGGYRADMWLALATAVVIAFYDTTRARG